MFGYFLIAVIVTAVVAMVYVMARDNRRRPPWSR